MDGFLDFPFHFDAAARTATTSLDDHVRDLIRQVLFTAPGERLMRPDFGSGLLKLVFEPNSSALAATTQMLVQGGLQQYLSQLIAVESVTADNVDSTLSIEVRYSMLLDKSAHVVAFTAPGSGA
jgi:phage baseplate assembly protein W